MLVGNSLPEYVFIRLTIIGLRSIAPLSCIYTFLLALSAIATRQDHKEVSRFRLPLPLDLYLILEAAFYLLVYLPLGTWLQHAATHPEAPSRAQRKEFWRKALDSVSNFETYLAGWFLGAKPDVVEQRSVEEYIAWSLFNEHFTKLNTAETQEVKEYAKDLENKCGRSFVSDSAKTRSLRTTFDNVPMQHRPLLWYLIVGMVDFMTHTRLLFSSLHYYRSSLSTTLVTFPPRPLAFLGRTHTPKARLSYWYREHTSKTKLPILLIHGIGIGLFAYTQFILQLASSQSSADDDGDIGIIVIEILPISSRIGPPALTTAEFHEELKGILAFHDWTDFVLVGHSYGTAIASTILRDALLSQRVKATVLMDPICFLLHLPDVAYNFTRRKPRRANERMLYYFSSQDMLISHTLARRFFWSEYILWKEDLKADLPLVVALSGKDLIVPTTEVWSYLTGSAVDGNVAEGERMMQDVSEWKEGVREVLWFEDFDHAGLLSSKGARRGVANIVKRLCITSIETES